MAFGAEIDEGCFEAGFHSGYLALVDVGFFLNPGTVFDVQVVEFLTIDECHPKLFFLGRID